MRVDVGVRQDEAERLNAPFLTRHRKGRPFVTLKAAASLDGVDAVLVDWMLDVCVDQRCHVDVFLLAANIMDRFLSTIRLRKKQFQLLGACAIFLASKMIEPSPVSALTLVRYTADTYDREELLVRLS